MNTIVIDIPNYKKGTLKRTESLLEERIMKKTFFVRNLTKKLENEFEHLSSNKELLLNYLRGSANESYAIGIKDKESDYSIIDEDRKIVVYSRNARIQKSQIPFYHNKSCLLTSIENNSFGNILFYCYNLPYDYALRKYIIGNQVILGSW